MSAIVPTRMYWKNGRAKVELALGRGKDVGEFELIDTGIFDDDRYFDVFVEYAKADVDDVLIRVTVVNRGPSPARQRAPEAWRSSRA